jgi:hypothetical protein
MAALVTATLASGCVDLDLGVRSRADGDCWASQGPDGQSAGCVVDGNGCGAEQGRYGQGGGCRLSA